MVILCWSSGFVHWLGCVDWTITGILSCSSHIVSKPMVATKDRMSINRAREWSLWTLQLYIRVLVFMVFMMFVDEEDAFGLLWNAG